eukprot:343646-Pleurochrysis_carterae.AAC.1
MIHNATEVCTTVQPTVNCLASAVQHTVLPAKDRPGPSLIHRQCSKTLVRNCLHALFWITDE